MANFQFEKVTLSDGRVVTIRELTGADEMLSLKLCSKEISLNENEIGAALMQQQNVLIVLSVLKIDDEPQSPPNSMQGALEFMAKLKMRDWNKIKTAYNKLNSGEDFLETPAN
jgi:hypothetical protein